jgi:hypothetical protein|tara:strand:+ start:855 stop:1055 length:201 start_codon:yes stop_codon:yes gene_type:complete
MTVDLNNEERRRYLEILKAKLTKEAKDKANPSNVRDLTRHVVDPGILLREIGELRDSEFHPHPYQM